MKTLKLISIFILGFAMMACSKDDDDDNVIIIVKAIQNLSFSTSAGFVHIEWDDFEGADKYVLYINDEELFNTSSAKISAEINNFEDGDVILVEAYSDSDLIASAKTTYIPDVVDDNGDDTALGDITGIKVMEMNHSYTLMWDAYSGTIEYYVYLNDTKVSDIPYSGTQAILSDIATGDVIVIKAYSDFDQQKLIATGTYTF